MLNINYVCPWCNSPQVVKQVQPGVWIVTCRACQGQIRIDLAVHIDVSRAIVTNVN